MPLIDRLVRLGLVKPNGEPLKRRERLKFLAKQEKKEAKEKERAARKLAGDVVSDTKSDSTSDSDSNDEDDGDDGDDENDFVFGTEKFKTEAKATLATPSTAFSSSPAAATATDDDDDDNNNNDDSEDDDKGSRSPSTPPTPAPLWPTDGSDDKIVYAPDSDYDSDCSAMSRAQILADERVRSAASRSHGVLSGLGRAEQLQERSAGRVAGGELTNKIRLRNGWKLHHQRERVPPKPCVVEIEYPTGDPSAGEGFRLWGFKEGKRVYKLESPYLEVLRVNLVKTAVGFCYIDVAAECPPRIVTVPAAAAAAATPSSPADDPASASTSASAVDSSATATDAGLAAASVSSAEHSTDSASATATTATANNTVNTSLATAPPAASASDKPVSTVLAVSTTVPPSLPPPTLEVNGMFAIRPSTLGGLGCFALKDIFRGDHLLVERPLIRTNMLHLQQELDRLTPDQRAQYNSLTGYHPDPRVSRDAQIWTANTFVAGELDGLFVVASRFNHACTESPAQNVSYRYDRQLGVLTMTAVGRIKKGTELLISYGKSRRMLHERFGFWCLCSGCGGNLYGDEDPASVQERLTEEMYKRIWS